ncbi:hypothetical protein [Paenibacillus macquariensis]|uniref:Uncharacterized protein n=1 Tax=Paenibacillus macquariensis TaxID=948756 RepID=A0ABY1KEI2_9BACL|nr:hypothetical protein [Paenibacillus macquariensis]MEC0093938.1 hypothetical protein [Paenibacillus macquariensis]OAB26909.1 hypothetical protein PMSM_25685 [Paenibacillus macquariensis subsp. macquariensis]SIR71401.1 hypothetical protein SAMN05421578_14111 [Paenibacillus macquariensis]
MNKLIVMVIVCAAFMILTTGCGGLFNAIEKDTVMVKKITIEHKTNEVKYEGVLSQDTVKTLSLNAVNKYYNEKLTMGEVQFELMAVDQKKLKELLDKLEYGVISRSKQNQGFKVNSETELNKIPSGLFYMTLTQSADPNEVYDIVVNARDGDVIKISKVNQNPKYAYGDKDPEVVMEGKVIMDEVIEIANRFIQEKGSYVLSDLTLDKKGTRWGRGIVAELYYRSKDKQSLNYSVMVNVRTKQVVGFNKDVMAMLSYFSES